MFKWDGSELTSLFKRKDVYWEEGIYEKNIYWRVYYPINNLLREEICIVRSCSSTLSCIIDEMKPIFKIDKLGTHWIKYKSKMLILIRPNIKNSTIIDEISLKYFLNAEKNIFFKKEVQRILLFRELLGISRSGESSIICRQTPLNVKPISFYEPNMTPLKEGKVISNFMLNKWFSDTSIDDEIIIFLNIKEIKDLTRYLFNLRIKFEEIVNRIDKDAIAYIDAILNRIQTRLQHILC